MNCYAVIGMGSIAKRHLANLRSLYPDAVIYSVSASGHNTELLDNASKVISFEELLLKKLQYVILASPAPYHVSAAKRLLENNISILIEKPLAHTTASCEELSDAIANSMASKSSTLAVGYCLRFLPSALIVKNYLESNLLGTIYNVHSNVGQYLPEWRKDKNYKDSVSARSELGGGALLELSHELDYLFWLFGDLELQHSWVRISDELELNVEDIADLVLTATSGVYVTVHLDFIQKTAQRTCEIIAEKGRLVWDLMQNTVFLHQPAGIEVLYSEPQYDKNNMYVDMLQAFELNKPINESHLATVESSTYIIKLIDEAKKMNKWR